MKKKRVLIFILSILSFVSILLTIVILSLNPVDIIRNIKKSNEYEDKCFTEISQFEKLDEYVTEDIDPKTDKRLKGLKYIESYTKKFEYNGKTYSLYAYVFEDEESAKKYYKRYSQGGGSFSTRNYGYDSYTLMNWFTTYSVYYDNCVFGMRGRGTSDFYDALNFVTEDFPISISELIKSMIIEETEKT